MRRERYENIHTSLIKINDCNSFDGDTNLAEPVVNTSFLRSNSPANV